MANEHKPQITIICLVYNQELYLQKCLNGFIMQKTNFAFEAIVHDDVSTDKSADIIREYATKYPDIIKPIYETENQYSKYGFGNIFNIILANSSKDSKYVAFCEGDDYWTDPLKLQKQFDFMEANPEYSMCFHNAMIHYQGGKYKDKAFAELEDRDYQPIELYEKWLVPTASIFARKDIYIQQQLKLNDPNFLYGDNPLIISLAYAGKVHCINEIMSVYRINIGSITLTINKNIDKVILHHKNMGKTFGKDIKSMSRHIISRISYAQMLQYIKEKKYFLSIRFLFLSLTNAPGIFIKNVIARIK